MTELAEGARLEIVYTPKAYLGFESPFLRQKTTAIRESCGGFSVLSKNNNITYRSFKMPKYRKIEAADDRKIAKIIRANLEKHNLDIPGTAYFDPQLDCLSAYYKAEPEKRAYFIALDENDKIIGGVGIAEFDGLCDCAEIQKLYLDDSSKGKGYGKELMKIAENEARKSGYKQLYLETHSNLTAAIYLYEKSGFKQIDRPKETVHGKMDRFYLKKL